MDIVWIILGAEFLLVGLGGCFLPALPGPPLSYVGMLLLHLTDKVQFTVTQLIVWAILVIVVQVLDYFTPLIGTKYGGGSKWGNRGCIAWTIVGMFVFPPWGIIFGPLVGAIIGELLGGKLTREAIKAGMGAFLGFLVGVVIKVSLCGYFVYVFVASLFSKGRRCLKMLYIYLWHFGLRYCVLLLRRCFASGLSALCGYL